MIPVTLADQLAEIQKRDLSYRMLHPAAIIYNEETDVTIEAPFSSITAKFHDYLSNYIVEANLTSIDCDNYRFRPKSLSYMIYGTTEFWSDILILNNCASIREFQPTVDKPVRYYDPSALKRLLNEIMIIEGIL